MGGASSRGKPKKFTSNLQSAAFAYARVPVPKLSSGADDYVGEPPYSPPQQTYQPYARFIELL
jgi:hypothetical protein